MRATALGAMLILAGIAAAYAAPLRPPAGEVLLTVTGAIDNTNAPGAAVFDQAMLDALPGRTTTTETPWYDGQVSFAGPLAAELLKAVGAHGTMVRVVALDDYAADIPLRDFLDSPVIFADRLDGRPMSVREKGPLFVIYPFDLRPDLYNEAVFGKSVWQVRSLDVHGCAGCR